MEDVTENLTEDLGESLFGDGFGGMLASALLDFYSDGEATSTGLGTTGFDSSLASGPSAYDKMVSASFPKTGWQNVGNKWFGKGLTAAEIMNNQFSREEAEKARNFSASMSNTAYQRQVADMQAAGVNPALMYGSGASGASTPSSSAASPVGFSSGLGFQEALSALMLPMQLAQAAANVANTKANTENIKVGTEGQKIDNAFQQSSFDARLRSIELKNSVDAHRIEEIDAHRNEMLENIKKIAADTDVAFWEGTLKQASAAQIVALLPYQKLLLEAQTDGQKATALAQTMHAMYENRLIDAGYIEAQISSMKTQAAAAMKQANAAMKNAETNAKVGAADIALKGAQTGYVGAQTSLQEQNAALAAFKQSVYNGTFFDTSVFGGNVLGNLFNAALSDISAVTTAIAGPLAGLIPSN